AATRGDAGPPSPAARSAYMAGAFTAGRDLRPARAGQSSLLAVTFGDPGRGLQVERGLMARPGEVAPLLRLVPTSALDGNGSDRLTCFDDDEHQSHLRRRDSAPGGSRAPPRRGRERPAATHDGGPQEGGWSEVTPSPAAPGCPRPARSAPASARTEGDAGAGGRRHRRR